MRIMSSFQGRLLKKKTVWSYCREKGQVKRSGAPDFVARVTHEHSFDFPTIIDCFTISSLQCQPPTEEAINRPPQRQ